VKKLLKHISIINKKKTATKPQIILISGLIFLVISKIILSVFEYWPVFNTPTIEVRANDKEVSSLEFLEKSYLLRFEFYNPTTQDITIGIDTNKKWDIYVAGERVDYSSNLNKIILNIKEHHWGKVDIRIEKHIPIKQFVDNLILIVVLGGIYLGIFNFHLARKVSWIGLFSFIVIFIVLNFNYLLKVDDRDSLAKIYQNSQYVKGQGSPFIMGDEQVYTFAAMEYLESGDPVVVNFEHPPLGKYIYGIGIKLFKYPRLVSLFLYLLVLAFFYLLCRQIFDRNLLPGAMLLFGYNMIFLDLIKTVMLDLPLLLFILLCSLFFIKAKNSSKNIWLIMFALALGGMSATKYYIPALIFASVCLLDILLNKRNLGGKYLLSLMLAPLVFGLSYWGYFEKHTLIEFIKFQWWLWHWFLGKTDVPQYGLIYLVLLTGKLKTWWALEYGKVISFSDWNITWPISLMSVLISICLFLKKLIKPDFIFFWNVFYLGFLSLGAFSPNLCIILLPFLLIQCIYIIDIKRNSYARQNAQ